uniref:Uncharacterized protein n=1 Tax=viral metagenome TaxID=1070528 RepID=A0A6M3IVJ4_9ZZZZ
MCKFLSYIVSGTRPDKKYLYLTHDLVYNTPRGKILQLRWPGDGGFSGHAAIRSYFETDLGMEVEQTDFVAPDRFPEEIEQAIKEGKFRSMGISYDLLTPEAIREYEKTEDQDIFWDLFSVNENRAEAWRDLDDSHSVTE